MYIVVRSLNNSQLENGNISASMASTAKKAMGIVPGLDFEFVTCVGRLSDGTYNAGSRELIRRHAMKDFVRRRRAGPLSNSVHPMPLASLDGTVKPKDPGKLTGRFKLLSWSRKKPIRNPNMVGQAVVSQHARQATKAAVDWRDRRKQDRGLPVVLVKTPSTGKFDPFNALPIDASSGIEALMHHCKYHRDSSFTFERCSDLLSLSTIFYCGAITLIVSYRQYRFHTEHSGYQSWRQLVPLCSRRCSAASCYLLSRCTTSRSKAGWRIIISMCPS